MLWAAPELLRCSYAASGLLLGSKKRTAPTAPRRELLGPGRYFQNPLPRLPGPLPCSKYAPRLGESVVCPKKRTAPRQEGYYSFQVIWHSDGGLRQHIPQRRLHTPALRT